MIYYCSERCTDYRCEYLQKERALSIEPSVSVRVSTVQIDMVGHCQLERLYIQYITFTANTTEVSSQLAKAITGKGTST